MSWTRARTFRVHRKLASEISGIGSAMSYRENGTFSWKPEGNGSSRYLNEKHEADVNSVIKINRSLMKLVGLWPMSYGSKNHLERYIARFLTSCCLFLLAFVLVTGNLYTFILEKNLATRIKLIGFMSFCVMSSVKYLSLMAKRRMIGRCIDDLVDNWGRLLENEERQIMYDYALYGRYGVTLCTCFIYGGGMLYGVVMPLLNGDIVIPDTNLTIRPLPCPAYLVFIDPQISPTYEIVYVIHCCSFLVMHTSSIVSSSLAIVFVVHACSQLEIVVSWLDRLVDRDGKENSFLEHSFDARLGLIVDQHVKTLNFISCTEKILREICLVDVFGSTLNLCLLGFDLLTEWKHSGPVAMFTYASLITEFLFTIFVFCYIGEMLTEECQKVGEKTYMIDWYELPCETALGLTLMIATANNPASITAGNLTKLSLTTFSSVLKTSVGYLNILRTLTA